MKLKAPIRLAGLFKKIEVLDSEGNVKRSIDGPKNLITDAGLLRMPQAGTGLPSQNPFAILKVSTDSTEPLVTDVSLAGYLTSTGGSSAAAQVRNLVEGYVSRTYTWAFPVGAVVGNISKLATGWESGANSNFSIALIKDAGGNPTTITMLADEQLRVSWELRHYWPTEDVTGVLVNEGNKGGTFEYRLRASKVSSEANGGPWGLGPADNMGLLVSSAFNNGIANGDNITFLYGDCTLGPITGNPTSTGGTSGTSNVATTSGSVVSGAGVTATISASTGQLNNAGGIGGVAFGSSGSADRRGLGTAWQASFTPPIMKTNEDIFEIDLQISCSRYEG